MRKRFSLIHIIAHVSSVSHCIKTCGHPVKFDSRRVNVDRKKLIDCQCNCFGTVIEDVMVDTILDGFKRTLTHSLRVTKLVFVSIL